MPRFVILEHDQPILHWDLMLEKGPALKTWRLREPPAMNGQSIEASPLADHRLHYLDYEGPLTGGRGNVSKWDAGTYEIISEETAPAIRIRLEGVRVRGLADLVKTENGWVFCVFDQEW